VVGFALLAAKSDIENKRRHEAAKSDIENKRRHEVMNLEGGEEKEKPEK
jgi:hypothetical protein